MNDRGFPATRVSTTALPSPGPGIEDRLDYGGSRSDLAKISITNSLATLATLGVYRFWAKNRVRRYLWSRIGLGGDQAEYTGSGNELFRGFLVALPAIALLFGLGFWLEAVLGIDHPVYWIVEAVSLCALIFLIYVAQYLARRYRLSRTEWRGIRFAQDGSSLRYGLLGVGWSIVVVLSLGTAYPVYRTRLQHYRTAHTSFGDHRFRFEARAATLLKPWLLAWLLLLPSLGLTYHWYRVREFRYFALMTRCGGYSFKSDLGARSVIVPVIVNFLTFLLVMVALVFALNAIASMAPPGDLGPLEVLGFVAAFAIAMPVVGILRMLLLVHPLMREIANTTAVIGDGDYASITQSRQFSPRRGEGLADLLDVGAI